MLISTAQAGLKCRYVAGLGYTWPLIIIILFCSDSIRNINYIWSLILQRFNYFNLMEPRLTQFLTASDSEWDLLGGRCGIITIFCDIPHENCGVWILYIFLWSSQPNWIFDYTVTATCNMYGLTCHLKFLSQTNLRRSWEFMLSVLKWVAWS